MVPANSHRISRAPCYSGYCYHYKKLPVRDYHPLWCDFPDTFQFSFITNIAVLQPRKCIATSTVWANARSLATTCAITFVFSSCGYLDVSVPHVCLPIYGMIQLHCTGLPHSDIPGSKVICTYPGLFAAYHVLHRLPEPRHPPFALICFFYIFLLVCRYTSEIVLTDVYLFLVCLDLYISRYTDLNLLTFSLLFLTTCQRSFGPILSPWRGKFVERLFAKPNATEHGWLLTT